MALRNAQCERPSASKSNIFTVDSKGKTASMLKIGAKRRRRQTDIVEQSVAEAMREQVSEELKRET